MMYDEFYILLFCTALLVFVEKGKITEKNNLLKSNGPWSLIITPPSNKSTQLFKTTLYVYNLNVE